MALASWGMTQLHAVLKRARGNTNYPFYLELHYFIISGEIDRCLKRVQEGVDTFEDTWQKVGYKGKWMHFKGSQLCQYCLLPFWKRGYFNRNQSEWSLEYQLSEWKVVGLIHSLVVLLIKSFFFWLSAICPTGVNLNVTGNTMVESHQCVWGMVLQGGGGGGSSTVKGHWFLSFNIGLDKIGFQVNFSYFFTNT